ncbi:DUF4229 domain-containing protein [Nocardioides sp.]|uniref:DUF4229 domain-containing protein n=1 Tax=Nocardioides sp. TaxID=35761 RepID=UPI0031FE52AD
MKEFVIYTGLRIVLFLASLGIVIGVWLLVGDNVPVLWAVAIAFLVSGVGSYFMLDRQRAAFAQRVEERAARASAAFEARKASEDVD